MNVETNIPYFDADEYDQTLNTLDIYFLSQRPGQRKKPMVVFIHGGGWTDGDTQTPSSRAWVTPSVVAPRLEQRLFRSVAANAEVSYHVYTPELYDGDKARRFPVIYWLHGSGSAVRGLPKLVEYFDRAMREGKLAPTLIVFPNGMAESMWCNSKDGMVPMETVLVDELIPQVDAVFRTNASRTGRLLEGFSMGGYGAARLGFKYPEIFGAVSMLGAGPMQRHFDASTGPSKLAPDRIRALQNVYGNDQAYFLAQSPWVMAERYADAVRGRSRVRIAVGNRDDMMGPNQDFADHLSRLQVPHDYHLLPNVGHDPLPLFEALGEANWDFYRAALGGKASTTDGEARGYATESGRRRDSAPEKIYPESLGDNPTLPKWFVDRGYVFVSVNFRLARHPSSPHATIHDMAKDIGKAIKWLTVNAHRYGGKSKGFVLLGYSSGAHLAALLITDATLLSQFRLSPTVIDGIIALDVPYLDIPSAMAVMETEATGLPQQMQRLANLHKLFGSTRATQERFSPAAYLRPGLCRTSFLLITTGLFDGYRQSLSRRMVELFVRRLRTLGVEAEHHHFENVDHAEIIHRFTELISIHVLPFLERIGRRPEKDVSAPTGVIVTPTNQR